MSLNINEIPLYALPSILDELDLKSLIMLCNSSKAMKSKCEDDYHQGKYINKIKNYKNFLDDYEKMSEIMLSIKYGGDVDLIRLMKDLNILSEHHAFNTASKDGKLDAMKLLQKMGNIDEEIAMRIASENEQLDAMKLIKKGWKNIDINNDLTDSLYTACAKGKVEAVKLLKKWGNFSNEELKIALKKASYRGQDNVVQLIQSWLN